MRYSRHLRDLSWLVERPIAHRGLHDRNRGVVENSASAFAAALSHHYAIECDLQLTADGEAVVFHDDTLNRVMEAEGRVDGHTVKELKALQFRHSSDRIQTLADLLDQVAGRATLVIELKSHWTGDMRLAARTVEVLTGYTGPFALMSFDPDVVAALAEMAPAMVRGITADRTFDGEYSVLPLARRVAMRNFHHLPRTRAHFVSFNFNELPFEPVSEIRAAGHPVISWTIKSPEAAARARRWSDQITFEGFMA